MTTEQDDAATKAANDQQPPTAGDPPPDIPTASEAKMADRIRELEAELATQKDYRRKEMELLASRNAAIHSIEGAKNRLAAEKKGLAEIEEKIASLIASGPDGQLDLRDQLKEDVDVDGVEFHSPWEDSLPAVPAESVRMLGTVELPTIDQIMSNLLPVEVMQGEKRQIKGTVDVYGTPWIVTAIWQDEATGALRANVVRLYTKEEWSQNCEAEFGRFVEDFDQNEDAKALRMKGGEWCGLVVKVGRKVFVVGPQQHALHLVHDPAPSADADQADRSARCERCAAHVESEEDLTECFRCHQEVCAKCIPAGVGGECLGCNPAQ